MLPAEDKKKNKLTSRWQSHGKAPRFSYVDRPSVKQFPTREDDFSCMPKPRSVVICQVMNVITTNLSATG